MTPRTGLRRRCGRNGEHGQMIVLFALCLMAIIAMAGLLIDGGMAWANRRQAQAAADTAALAAAKAIVAGATDKGLAAAQAVAGANGFGAGTDCDGKATSVTVNSPPSDQADPAHWTSDYVEVTTTRKMTTTFAGAWGQSCWMVSARAVASVGAQSAAKCSFCSLNNGYGNHTLVLKNGSTLRVDGDIYVNSQNGLTGNPKGKDISFDGTTCAPDQSDGNDKNVGYYICGDGFDIFGDGGYISAQTISVVGGWETHQQNIAYADGLAQVHGSDCPLHTQPTGYGPLYVPPGDPKANPKANVCIGMPAIADPLNDPANSKNIVPVPPVVGPPVSGLNGCVAGGGPPVQTPTGTSLVPARMTVTAAKTICPGTYYGGLTVSGSGSITMLPGVYYMAGGGFIVTGAASVNGSAGVMIYNASGNPAVQDSTNPGVDLIPTHDKKDKSHAETTATMSHAPASVSIRTSVTLTLTVSGKAGHIPTGTIDFYEGQNVISGCGGVIVTPTGNNATASCTTSWPTWGTKSLTGVYSGDTWWFPTGDTDKITIPSPPSSPIQPINVTTTGIVVLHGATSGTYTGVTLFQDRSSALTITLDPEFPATGRPPWAQPSCPASWMTIGVPDGVAPDPCDALGGLQGTVYAGNQDALVDVRASGLANLQIISGMIQIVTDDDARFAYAPQFFANGGIRLVE